MIIKLKSINNKVTTNKTRDVAAVRKLNDLIASYTKLINDLLGEVSKKIQQKNLITRDLIN